MRTVKLVRTAAEEAAEESAADEAQDWETYEIVPVSCPDCGQPIALLAGEESLPEHALCTSPWDPFGLTVCQGSGRAAHEATPLGGGTDAREHELGALLTLPEELDWRTQPFSHALRGGPRHR